MFNQESLRKSRASLIGQGCVGLPIAVDATKAGLHETGLNLSNDVMDNLEKEVSGVDAAVLLQARDEKDSKLLPSINCLFFDTREVTKGDFAFRPNSC